MNSIQFYISGYSDTGEYWKSFYESATFEEDLESLLHQLSPLYQQLHAFVRAKLQEVYGRERFPETGHIPAHLLGKYQLALSFLAPNSQTFC